MVSGRRIDLRNNRLQGRVLDVSGLRDKIHVDISHLPPRYLRYLDVTDRR